MDGILNVYKESGYTSFDVVARLRRILHQKKIGHTGTLDPQAEGVLVVCLGKATKCCDILPDHDKEYEATLLLGMETDTEDTSGTVVRKCPVMVSEEEIRTAVSAFQGTYEQVPPMYSALKVNGKKLYELARQGMTVKRQPRPVTIYRLEIIAIQLPRVVLRIQCSRGTYIRSLCRDIGMRLGCGGCMETLVRIRACGFLIEDSLRLSEIECRIENDTLKEKIVSVDSMYPDYPRIYIKDTWDRLGYNGNKLTKEQISGLEENFMHEGPNQKDTQRFLAYDSKGCFLGIYEYHVHSKEFVPYKMFL